MRAENQAATIAQKRTVRSKICRTYSPYIRVIEGYDLGSILQSNYCQPAHDDPSEPVFCLTFSNIGYFLNTGCSMPIPPQPTSMAPRLSLCFSLSRQTSSDLTSMSETDSDGGGPARGVLLWRHVRMIVRGVRGMRGVLGEGSRLERTVAYRAARCEHACCRELYQAAASRCM